MSNEIPGLKLIKHNANRIDLPDDPSYPYKLELLCRPPESMAIAFIGLFGGREELVVRAMTKEALETFIVQNEYRTHPRLSRLTVTGPEGLIEELPKKKDPAVK